MSDPSFSVSQITTLPQPFDEDLRTYAAAGADGIGIWEIKLPERSDVETRDRLRESGLAVTNCIGAVPSILPLPLLPGPDDPGERVAAFCASIRRLAQFEPDCLVLLTGPAGDRADAERVLAEGLRTIAAEAARAGVRVALEPYQREAAEQWSVVSSLGEAAVLLDRAETPDIGLLFDAWHLWNTPYEEELPRLIDRVAGVHVSDYRDPTRGWLDRVLPGDGVGDVPRVLRALERAGWRGPYDVEIFSDNGAFGEAYPDSLWDVPGEELARRARAAFLRCWARRDESLDPA